MEHYSLQELKGKLAGGYSLAVKSKQLKKSEQSFFQVFLVDSSGEESQQPVFEGLYSVGIEPYIDGWIDGHYYEDAEFGESRLNLQEKKLDVELFRKLGETLEPSWSFMVAYESFLKKGKTLDETARGLNCGVPPIATPIGYLLFGTGRIKTKDWYFPEGGNEGMPKLEGVGAVDRKHAARMRKETAGELKLFLKKGACHDKELEMPARERAKEILKRVRY